MKKILVIGTGGTIAGVAESGKTTVYKSGELGIDSLCIDIFEQLAQHIKIETYQMCSIDSREMSIEQWVNLGKLVDEKAKMDYDGFVITHGTDTLEETAYFLNLTLKTEKPVIMTGAMRPFTAASADGKLNLYQSIVLASHDESYGKGVLVAFNDTIYCAQNVQKNNCFKTDGFVGKDSGPVGTIRDDNVFFFEDSLKKHTTNSEFEIKELPLPKVEIAYFYTEADPQILDSARKNSKGLVVAGVGNGGCNFLWNKKINEYASSGFPVVKSTRVAEGVVMSEKDMNEFVIYANEHSPQKSRILLMLGLTKTHDPKTLQEYFNQY